MCLPVAGIAAATWFQAASLAVTAVATYSSISSQKANAEYNADIARNNQIIANQRGDDAIRRGELDEIRHRLKVEQVKGSQRSALAAQGVDLSDGSALDAVLDTAEYGELDALIIRKNAEREAYGYRVQGYNAGAQANLYDSQASNLSPFTSTLGTVLSGASSVADSWSSAFGSSGSLVPATAGGVPVSSWNGQ